MAALIDRAPSDPPRDAATVVVVRQSAVGAEVLLLHRLEAMKFAAGEWVFPGGVIEPGDRSRRLIEASVAPDDAIIDSLRSRAARERSDIADALAICIGGCRETFEESGILLARHRDGRPCSGALVASLQAEREAIAGDASRFVTLLERNDLVLELDALVYWSNWVTPPVSPRRYDTRFFVTPLPAGQEVDARLGEAQAARWVALRDDAFLRAFEPPLSAPPTLLTLRELARLEVDSGSVAELIQAARSLTPVTVMLKVLRRGDAIEALFPWDEQYATTTGPGVALTESLQRRLGRYPSRLSVDSAAIARPAAAGSTSSPPGTQPEPR